MSRRLEPVRGGRLLVAGAGALLVLVPVLLARTGALTVQVVAAGAGALLATGGLSLMRGAWPRRRITDLHYLLFAVGFFLLCAGFVTMLAGVGLYH